jgi:glutamyl-tRNA synthetase
MTRTRFAPSPTGYLHIGGLRTALYNYLHTKKHDGTFLLRIEDTDRSRFIEGAMENLIETLNKVGLHYDEGPHKEANHGPYIQSERTDLYRKYADQLIKNAHAYHCFCTPERLTEMRERQAKNKQAPMYDRTCLNLDPEEVKSKIDAGIPFVIRQKIPHGKTLTFNDHIRGEVSFDTGTIDDQVLMKSDNYPTYHLANVVDDHHMEISHVIRGEEWLPSTPKHILLYQAFGWDVPEYAHIPLLLNKDKSKLSKRQGDVSVESYLAKGYCPEAIINFIALLGWHPGEGEEKEVYTLEELINLFSLEKVHKAGAIFDIEKLDWFNYVWNKKNHNKKLASIAKKIDPDVIIDLNHKKEPVYTFQNLEKEKEFNKKRGELLKNMVDNHLKPEYTQNHDLLLKALVTNEDKILKSPLNINELIYFFYERPHIDQAMVLNEKMKVTKEIALKGLQQSVAVLEKLDNFEDLKVLQQNLIELVQKLEIKNGQLLWPIRVALTAVQFSPGTFEMLWALGKDESLKRINLTIEALQKS